MKKQSLLFIVLLFQIINVFAQQKSYYKQFYDEQSKSYFYDVSKSPLQERFSWGGSALIVSLYDMYENSGDIKYLNKLIECMGNIMDRRDDLREGLQYVENDTVKYLSKIYDYRGVSGATWATDAYNKRNDQGEIIKKGVNYAHLVHSGNITHPMAKFAALVKKDLSLQNEVSPDGGRYGGMLYIDIANDLIARIEETLNYHEDQWEESGNMGWYRIRCGSNVPLKHFCVKVPLNYLGSIGRIFVLMYVATDDSKYLDKIYKIANYMKSRTTFDPTTGSMKWTYWEYNTLREDLSHGGVTLAFPYECYKNNITYNGTEIYDFDYMKGYARTFTKDVYRKPLELNNGVDYDDFYFDFKHNQQPLGKVWGGGYYCAAWLPYSEFDYEIYQSIADLFTSKVYNDSVSPITGPQALSYLDKYKRYIVPITAEHGWGVASNWAGVAAGNFRGNIGDEFVTVRNSDGKFYLQQITGKKFIDKKITSISGKAYDESYNWAGIASGNFFGDAKDEFIALSNHSIMDNNGFYIFKVQNNSILEQSKSTGWGTGSNWAGLAAGNFISGGYDDIVSIRNYRKQLRIHKFNNNGNLEIINTTELNLPIDSTVKTIAAGNLDNDPKSEIVVLVNSSENTSNGFYIYDVNDNGTISLITKSTGWGRSSNWSGLTIGDFNADGVDEFIVQRDSDGIYRIYGLCGNSICSKGYEHFSKQQVQNNILGAGNLDPSSENDELVVLRNDGGVVVFSNSNPTISEDQDLSDNLKINISNNDREELYNDNENQTILYPNPTNGIINLVSKGDMSTKTKYELYDVTGNLLEKGDFIKSHQIDISKNRKAIYLIKLYYSNNKIEIKKVIYK